MKYLFSCVCCTWMSLRMLLIRMSRPSTSKLALDVFPPATTVYWPASDILVEGMMRRWTYLSRWIFILMKSEKKKKKSEQVISWEKIYNKSQYGIEAIIYLSPIWSSCPSFIHWTWMSGSEISHSKIALFFSTTLMSLICFLNSMWRAVERWNRMRAILLFKPL